MPYYRINVNLTTKHKINSIANLELPQATIDKLLAMEAISVISTPPLKFMPLWDMRAEKLEPLGVITGLELLNSNSEDLAKKLDKDTQFVEQWKQDLIDDLVIEFEKATCGC